MNENPSLSRPARAAFQNETHFGGSKKSQISINTMRREDHHHDV